MDFESMDWEAEAKRVAEAFRVQHLCQFYESEFWAYTLKLVFSSESTHEHHPKVGDAELSVEYTAHYRCYSLERFHANMIGLGSTEVMLHCDGTSPPIHRNDRNARQMAEALFCLGLLTPEIETVT